MPTGSKTAVSGRGKTNDTASILDPRNGMYTCKPYQPQLYDFKYREYKYKPYKPVYVDPLTKKIEVLQPYRSHVGYKRSSEYQLPKQDDLSVRKEEPANRESYKEKSPKQSKPLRKPPVIVTNNNVYNEATELKLTPHSLWLFFLVRPPFSPSSSSKLSLISFGPQALCGDSDTSLSFPKHLCSGITASHRQLTGDVMLRKYT